MKPSKGVEKRGKQTRKRNPIVLYAAEGDNKTESTYLQNFQKRNGIHIVQASGNRTDAVKMMNHLVTEAREIGLYVKDGDRAFCLIDTDTDKDKQVQIDAACARETELVKVITSAPCFEEWFLCHYRWSTGYQTSSAAVDELKARCPGYRKSSNIYPHIKDLQDTAITNAKRLEQFHRGQGRDVHSVDSNPRSEMYKVIEFLTK